MESSGDKSENPSIILNPTQLTPSDQNIPSIFKEKSTISAAIHQKKKLTPLHKVKKRFKIRGKPSVKKHQAVEYYMVSNDGELVKDSAENEWSIISIESENEPEKILHHSITNDNLVPFEDRYGSALKQSKRNFIFDKCFSIVHREDNKIQAKCMLCNENNNKFIRGDERSISNFVTHIKVRRK